MNGLTPWIRSLAFALLLFASPARAVLTANAGPDQVVSEGDAVTLTAAASTETEGTITAYAWKQIGGGPVALLTGATTVSPTLTAPQVGTAGAILTYQVTVTSSTGSAKTDTVAITVVDSLGGAPAASGQTLEEYLDGYVAANLTVPGGASLVGIADAASLYTATTVEGALAEEAARSKATAVYAQDYGTLTAGAVSAAVQATNRTTLQTAINAAATAKKRLLLPAGHYQYSGTLYGYYDVTLNPGYPTNALDQGDLTVVGSGDMGYSDWNGGAAYYKGTVLEGMDASGPILKAESAASPWPIRGLRFKNVSIIGNCTGYVVSYKGVHTGSGFDEVFIGQAGTGGGLFWEDTWMIQSSRLSIAKAAANIRTGNGLVIRNANISGGLVNIDYGSVEQFSTNVTIGHTTYGSGASLSGVTLNNVQGINGSINFELGQGSKATKLNNIHSEGATTAGFWARNLAGKFELSGYFYNADATEGDIILGDDALSGVAREIQGGEIHSVVIAQADAYGIRRKLLGTQQDGLTVHDCIITAKDASSIGIDFGAYTTQRNTRAWGNRLSGFAAGNDYVNATDLETLGLDGETRFGDPVQIQGVQYARARVTASTASVKSLFGTPFTLVAAPGSGYYLEFVSAHLWLDYETTAYDGIAAGEDLEIRYTDASGQEVASVEATGFLDQAADTHRIVYAASSAPTTPETITPVENAALVLVMSTGNIATGDSPLKVEVVYRRRALTW